jgi:glycosyltransferase involved in cell wall biosynthesis
MCPEMESEFALCFAGRVSDELQMNGARVHLLGGVRASRPWTVHRARVRLRDLLQKRNFDAVVCHSAWSQAILGPAVLAARLPLVFYLHGATTGRHWLDRWASRALPDLVICNSRYTQSSAPLIFPSVSSKVIYCAVAPSGHRVAMDQVYTRKELGTSADSVVIIQVSRMEPWKGHALHLQGLAKLRHTPRWTAWIVGGPQRPSELCYLKTLLRKAESLGIGDRVRFLGECKNVPRLLAAADIYCQPNLEPEPFGITFVEALQAGVPIVTTALGAAKEIVDGSCGILVRPGDAEALAQVLGQLIQDASLRVNFGARGPDRAKELCAPGKQVKALMQAVSEAISKNREMCVDRLPA